MKYFSNCKTLDEVKTMYRQLAKQHHPDTGGDTATMQAINKEYALACAKILNGSSIPADEVEKEMRFSEEYRQVIEAIINIPGITIELIGMWIWVTGNTYPVRQQLKEAGFHFAHKKVAWYYRSEYLKVLRGSNKSLEEIRDKYGSETVGHHPTHSKALRQ